MRYNFNSYKLHCHSFENLMFCVELKRNIRKSCPANFVLSHKIKCKICTRFWIDRCSRQSKNCANMREKS